jgi:hypothetical protein
MISPRIDAFADSDIMPASRRKTLARKRTMTINGNMKLAAHLGATTTIVTCGGERVVGRMVKLFKNAVEISGCRFYGERMVEDVVSRFLFSDVTSITVET